MTPELEEFIKSHPVARLATADASGCPSVVPVCFVLEEAAIYIALDQKPKSVPVLELKRVRNIIENPEVALVVDDYSDDWNQLAYALVHGRASMLHPSGDALPEHQRIIAKLKGKYPQYRSMAIEANPVIKIDIRDAKLWRSTAHH